MADELQTASMCEGCDDSEACRRPFMIAVWAEARPRARARVDSRASARSIRTVRALRAAPLSQEAVRQPAVHGDHVAGRLAQATGEQQEDGLGLVVRLDRKPGERALRIECRQL